MQKNDPKYFDYAASSPPYREALDVFAEVSARFFANPSSMHRSGAICRKKLGELRNSLCDLLGFSDGRLFITSSATEVNNTIVQGHLQRNPSGKVFLAENVHDSLWFARQMYSDRSGSIKINNYGQVEKQEILTTIGKKPALLCISHGCNETGTKQHLEEIAALCYYHQVPLLVDGAQTTGRISLKVDEIPCSYYTFSAHKFGAPRGIGGAFIRDGAFGPMLYGGPQEWGLRAGTECIAGLAASVEALQLSVDKIHTETTRLDQLKSLLLHNLKQAGVCFLENSPEGSLPGFLSLSFPGHSGREIVGGLSLSGFSLSTGSACHADQVQPSRAILAMGRNTKEALGTVRITMGRYTTRKSVAELGDALIEYVRE